MLSLSVSNECSHLQDAQKTLTLRTSSGWGFFEDPNPLMFRRKGSDIEGLLLTSPHTNMASRNGIITRMQQKKLLQGFHLPQRGFPHLAASEISTSRDFSLNHYY